jgi:indolepyruvate ferredoxin oxidoreductase beta subunit
MPLPSGRLKVDQGAAMKDTINFLLAGVGGQGTILASDLLVNVGMAAGLQAKQAEVHGLSQRGGSVTSYVRWGQVVYSPLVGAGEVDVYLAFEKLEALRHLNKIRPGALVIVNMETILPVSMLSGSLAYPDDECLRATIAKVTSRVVYIDAAGMAASLGNLRVANVVLLGALSALLEDESLLGPKMAQEIWLKAIAERVPSRFIQVNQQAFEAGRQEVLSKNTRDIR